jgi:hypothetical protein
MAVYGQSVRLGAEPLETQSQSDSESELLYGWRFTANQFVLKPSRLRLTGRIFFSIEHPLSYSLCNILSDERMSLSFIIAAGPRQQCILRYGNVLRLTDWTDMHMETDGRRNKT